MLERATWLLCLVGGGAVIWACEEGPLRNMGGGGVDAGADGGTDSGADAGAGTDAGADAAADADAATDADAGLDAGATAPFSWGTSMAVDTSDAGRASNPAVAVEADGGVLVLWQQGDSIGGFKVWARRYTPDAGWGIPSASASIGQYIQNMTFAIDAAGTAFAAWEVYLGAYALWAMRYAGTWATAKLVATNDAGVTGITPRLAIDSAGNAFAVWRQWASTRYDAWANRYSVAGATWGDAGPLEKDAVNSVGQPSVAALPNGEALAVWDHADGGQWSIMANRYTDGGWQTAALIETEASGDMVLPTIAANDAGIAVAVWFRYVGGIYNAVYWNRYVAGAGWSDAGLVEAWGGSTAVYGPQVAVDSAGNVVALWHAQDFNRYIIRAARYSDGGWSASAVLGGSVDMGRAPSIAIDSAGNAIAAWHDPNLGAAVGSVWAVRYAVGAGWGDAGVIGSHAAGAANPRVALNAAGRGAVVWEAQADAGLLIWLNISK